MAKNLIEYAPTRTTQPKERPTAASGALIRRLNGAKYFAFNRRLLARTSDNALSYVKSKNSNKKINTSNKINQKEV